MQNWTGNTKNSNYSQTSFFCYCCFVLHRQLHVMDETHVINQVKEDVCYVSQDFYKDMEIAKYGYNTINCESWYFWIIICTEKNISYKLEFFPVKSREVLPVKNGWDVEPVLYYVVFCILLFQIERRGKYCNGRLCLARLQYDQKRIL